MKISPPTWRSVIATLAITALAGCLAACSRGGDAQAGESGDAASPGITDTTITFGTTSPLTGPAAGVGNCAADGAVAYFEARNAAGGIAFGDGKTRTVEFRKYDDGYDPQRAASNFQQMVTDDVFGAALSLGTPTNRAWRDAAIAEHFPQVLVQTGDPLFSDREESPWQLGLIPTYAQEGKAFGEMLIASGKQHRVAILFQNDDFGKGYVDGFKEAVAGNDDVTIVKEVGYEATATDVSAQITDLASTDADVFFNGMSSLASLVIGSLQQADAVAWHPSIFLPSTSSSPAALLGPSGVADHFPAIYSAGSSQSSGTPGFANSAEGSAFLTALDEHTDQQGVPGFPQCLWSWIGASVLEQAFTKMTEPTRESFMTALRSISGYEAPFLLEGGTIDTTRDGLPAMNDVVILEYNGTGLAPVG